MSKELFIDAVPLRRLPPGLDRFTYRVPADIKVTDGDVVLVPFKQQRIPAVVVGSATKISDKNIKNIAGYIPIRFTPEQLALTDAVARFYYQSQATILNSIAPVLPKRSYNIKAAPRSDKDVPPAKQLSSQYVLYSTYEESLAFVKHISTSVTDGQLLILAPERSLRNRIQDLTGALQMPSRTKKNEYLDAWKKVARASIVVGSEKALFLPVSRLAGVIVLDAEHSAFHAAEQNPHMRLPDILRIASHVYQCPIIVSGFSPEVQLLHEARTHEQPVRQVGEKRAIEIITESGQSGVKEAVYHGLEGIIESSKKSLLIWNRLGTSRSVVCDTCGESVTCERCGRFMISERDELLCAGCGSTTKQSDRCKNCGSQHTSHRGKGIQSIVNELSKLYPNKQVVGYSRLSDDIRLARAADIVVATNAIFSHAELHFDTGVFLNPDVDLLLPTMYAAESLRHYVYRMNSIADRVIVQTRSPEQPFYSTLSSVSKFYQYEIGWREKFSYPPFGKMIQISVTAESDTTLSAKEDELIQKFRQWSFIGPFRSRKRETYMSAILIKQADSAPDSELDAVLANAYTAFHVDINPYVLPL